MVTKAEAIAELKRREAVKELQRRQPTMQPGTPREAFGMELSSAIPFGGRITSALAAGATAPFVDENFGELYRQAQEFQRITREAEPTAATLGTLAGIGTTLPLSSSRAIIGSVPRTGMRGAINAIPQALQNVGQFVSTGGLGARIAKGAATAAPAGALFGAGEAQEGQMLEGAIRGAGMAALTAGALPIIGSAFKSLKNVTPAFSGEQLRKLSRGRYNSLAEVGEVITPKSTEEFIENANKLKPRPLAGRIFTSEDREVINAIDEYAELSGAAMNLDDANRLYKSIGEKINRNMQPGTATPNSTGRILIELQDAVEDMINKAPGSEKFNEAKKLWQISKKTEDVERILERADMVDNAATAIKTGFRTIANNPKRLRGYSGAERKLIKDIAKGDSITDSLRTLFGSRLYSGLFGGLTAGPVGIAGGAAASAAARGAAEARMVGKAMRLLNEIQSPAIDMSLTELKKASPRKMTEVLTLIGAAQMGGMQ